MKRNTKYIIILILIALIWGLYNVFTPEITEFKEQYLIKKNYTDNEEVFKRTISDFDPFKNISIEFDEGNYMDAFTSGFHYITGVDSIDFKGLYEQGDIAEIRLSDSISTIEYKNTQNEIKSFKIIESQIEVELFSDSTIVVDKYWSINYSGYCKTELFSELLKTLNLNTNLLEQIKNLLRQRNCFGFSNFNDILILHFRSPPNIKLLVCSYSYCIVKDRESWDKFVNGIYTYGKLDEHVYWFFNDAIQNISLFPSGYENRNI